MLRQRVEQADEQRGVAVGADGEVEVRDVGGGGAARVDEDHAHLRPRFLGGGEALVQHRVAPAEIGPDEDDEVGELKVLVVAGNRVRAEGALVARNGRGHAEA